MSKSLLNSRLCQLRAQRVIHKDDPVGTVDIPSASLPVAVNAAEDLFFTASRWKPVPAWAVKVTPLPLMPQAPIAAGTKLGTFSILVAGKVQATGDAVAAQDVAVKPAVALARTTREIGTVVLKGLAAVIAAALVCLAGVILYVRTASKIARRRRDRLASRL